MINGNQRVYTNCVIDICSFTHFNDLILSVFFSLIYMYVVHYILNILALLL